MSDQQLLNRLHIIWGCFLAKGISLAAAETLSKEYEETETELRKRGRLDLIKQFSDGFCF